MTNAQSKIALCQENYPYWNPDIARVYTEISMMTGLEGRRRYGHAIVEMFYNFQYYSMIEA